jgi:hypothetical protein
MGVSLIDRCREVVYGLDMKQNACHRSRSRRCTCLI